MKKVEVIKETPVCGLPKIPAGTQFKVGKSNSRFVYVKYYNCELRLSSKDVKVIY